MQLSVRIILLVLSFLFPSVLLNAQKIYSGSDVKFFQHTAKQAVEDFYTRVVDASADVTALDAYVDGIQQKLLTPTYVLKPDFTGISDETNVYTLHNFVSKFHAGYGSLLDDYLLEPDVLQVELTQVTYQPAMMQEDFSLQLELRYNLKIISLGKCLFEGVSAAVAVFPSITRRSECLVKQILPRSVVFYTPVQSSESVAAAVQVNHFRYSKGQLSSSGNQIFLTSEAPIPDDLVLDNPLTYNGNIRLTYGDVRDPEGFFLSGCFHKGSNLIDSLQLVYNDGIVITQGKKSYEYVATYTDGETLVFQTYAPLFELRNARHVTIMDGNHGYSGRFRDFRIPELSVIREYLPVPSGTLILAGASHGGKVLEHGFCEDLSSALGVTHTIWYCLRSPSEQCSIYPCKSSNCFRINFHTKADMSKIQFRFEFLNGTSAPIPFNLPDYALGVQRLDIHGLPANVRLVVSIEGQGEQGYRLSSLFGQKRSLSHPYGLDITLMPKHQ